MKNRREIIKGLASLPLLGAIPFGKLFAEDANVNTLSYSELRPLLLEDIAELQRAWMIGSAFKNGETLVDLEKDIGLLILNYGFDSKVFCVMEVDNFKTFLQTEICIYSTECGIDIIHVSYRVS